MTRRHLVPTVLGAIVVTVVLVFHSAVLAWFSGKPVGGSGAGSAVTSQAGALKVSAALDPDPPRQNGALVLDVTDASGNPVVGAHVSAEYDMPAMGAMQEMKGAAKVSAQGGGRYRVDFELPMSGTWGLNIAIDAAGASTTVHYRLTTGTKGLTAEGAAAGGSGSASGGDVAYYTCSMHTSVRSETPGTCPLCSMPLKPVSKDEVATGIVTITQDRRDAFGIRVAPVVSAPMHAAIRAVGKVAYDETKLADVTLRLKGWITHLDVDATGQQVRRGQRMLTLYSPDLYAAEQEYLLALASGPSTEMLANAAKRKLTLWGLTEAQVAEIAKRGEPLQDVPITAPASGYVIEKDVVEGAAVDAGARLFRIAALDDVWVEAELFEGDLPLVKPGQAATITLSYLPGRTFTGKVAFVYPYLDPQTRTGRVRITLPNKDLALKPDMYANVALDSDLGQRLQIPISAVVYTGRRRIVFVDLGDGKLQPVEVQLGARSDDLVEVVSGLSAGQKIVVAGNFLVAAESRIRAASFWTEGDHGGK
jgi:membrane fusion protein, copper/silver efflux system